MEIDVPSFGKLIAKYWMNVTEGEVISYEIAETAIRISSTLSRCGIPRTQRMIGDYLQRCLIRKHLIPNQLETKELREEIEYLRAVRHAIRELENSMTESQ